LRPHLEVLARPQRLFWDEAAVRVPRRFALYGGTAIALRLGHRQSVDFDFFSETDLGSDEIERDLCPPAHTQTLERGPQTLVAALTLGDDEVRLAFFGKLGIGRVGIPDVAHNGVTIASSLDLLATKLTAQHDRIEAKDYLDIEALLRSGPSLSAGIMAARALFGPRLNPLDTAKAVAWFKDGDLERTLPARTRSYLERAVADFDPATPIPRRLAMELTCAAK
jgi:hypothetical protein